MTPGDNPPVGWLLCTHKNQALAEYALTGMSVAPSALFSGHKLSLTHRKE